MYFPVEQKFGRRRAVRDTNDHWMLRVENHQANIVPMIKRVELLESKQSRIKFIYPLNAESRPVGQLCGRTCDICLLGLEFKGDGIDAIALSSGLRPIRKNMPQMRIAAGAQDLCSRHAKSVISAQQKSAAFHAVPKAGPARSGFKFFL